MASAPAPQGTPKPSAPQAPTQDNNQPFDVFSQDMAFPSLPGPAKHQPTKPPAYDGRVPDLDAGMLSALPAAQRTRLQTERDNVTQMDQQVQKVSSSEAVALLQCMTDRMLKCSVQSCLMLWCCCMKSAWLSSQSGHTLILCTAVSCPKCMTACPCREDSQADLVQQHHSITMQCREHQPV